MRSRILPVLPWWRSRVRLRRIPIIDGWGRWRWIRLKTSQSATACRAVRSRHRSGMPGAFRPTRRAPWSRRSTSSAEAARRRAASHDGATTARCRSIRWTTVPSGLQKNTWRPRAASTGTRGLRTSNLRAAERQRRRTLQSRLLRVR